MSKKEREPARGDEASLRNKLQIIETKIKAIRTGLRLANTAPKLEILQKNIVPKLLAEAEKLAGPEADAVNNESSFQVWALVNEFTKDEGENNLPFSLMQAKERLNKGESAGNPAGPNPEIDENGKKEGVPPVETKPVPPPSPPATEKKTDAKKSDADRNERNAGQAMSPGALDLIEQINAISPTDKERRRLGKAGGNLQELEKLLARMQRTRDRKKEEDETGSGPLEAAAPSEEKAPIPPPRSKPSSKDRGQVLRVQRVEPVAAPQAGAAAGTTPPAAERLKQNLPDLDKKIKGSETYKYLEKRFFAGMSFEELMKLSKTESLKTQKAKGLVSAKVFTEEDLKVSELGVALREFEELEKVRSSQAFRFLESLYMLGMSLDEMEGLFEGKNNARPGFVPSHFSPAALKEASSLFRRSVEAGRDPLQRLAAEATIASVPGLKYLNPADQKRAEARFLAASREVWKDFVFGAKLDWKTGEPKAQPEMQDIDVKVALWLLQKAGFTHAGEAKAVRQGEQVAGAINIDTGGMGRAGAVIHRAKEDKERYRTGQGYDFASKDGFPVVSIDNHPGERQFRTSSSKILYNLLDRGGFFAGLEPRERRAIEMMVKYSVDCDNASLPSSKAGELADFKNSAKTLRGLGRYMNAEQLFEYFKRHGNGRGNTYRENYIYAVTEHEFNEKDLKACELDRVLHYRQKKPVRVQDQIREEINQAEAVLEKEGDELLRAGKIVKTRLGTYVVDITDGKQNDKLRLGFIAAKAYGYDGYLAYDSVHQSFMLNTLNPWVDLSRDPDISKLVRKQGVIVRGAMYLKPPTVLAGKQEPLQITLREILETIASQEFKPQGRIAEFLEKESKGQLIEKPVFEEGKLAGSPAAPAAGTKGPEKAHKEKEVENGLKLAMSLWEEALREALGNEYTEEEINDIVKIMGKKEAEKMLKELEEADKKKG